MDYYSRADETMYSVNFRKGSDHADLFDEVGDPGYHFSDHASWDKRFGYWLERNFGQHNEFGPRKGSTAEVVGQEIGAFVYQAYPGSLVAELLTGMEGPQTQTVVGTGATYAMMLITPGGAARGGAGAARSGIATARILGAAGEKAVGITGPKKVIYVAGRTRIPDRVGDGLLEEVKNVGHLSFTGQLRDFYQYSQKEGLKMILHTRSSTTFSRPLQRLIDDDLIIRKNIPGL